MAYAKRRKMTSGKAAILAAAGVLLLVFLFPYYYILLQSLTPWAMVDKTVVPVELSLRSYVYLFSNGGADNSMMWLRALFNSVLVSGVSTVFAVVSGLLTAYALTKLRLRGAGLLYNFILFEMFFPGIILLVPQYILLKPLVNNYLGLMVPTLVSLWAIMMYYNHFKTFPTETLESARIDGASEFRIALQIALPIARTISIVVFLSIFLGRWSELMWDMLMAPDVSMQTLNVLITTQFKPMGNLPGPLYAASTILTLPILALFLVFSKYFKEGIAIQFK